MSHRRCHRVSPPPFPAPGPDTMGSRLSLDDSVRVVVVGGGFGGTAAASLLKSWAVPFVLVDVRDAFHHNVAALRAAVESGKGSADVHGHPSAWVPVGQLSQPHQGPQRLGDPRGVRRNGVVKVPPPPQ